ncbi:MAG: chemotaxis response regulator protein-glutamate methylesterase [Candidatus Methanoperedens sp.]|nr:chemotaxis response regulator protein-glutamate methylesterase [Candidatus Methanoperedens sp.]
MSRIKVLVVDDSALMRKVISDILASFPDIEVIGKAKNGQDAIEKVTSLRPDVVTMDIEMPVLNGLNALGYIMSECPTPVIMLSGDNSADITITAFQYGAVDFILKPSGEISRDIANIKDELIKKVRAAAGVAVQKLGFIEEKRKKETIAREPQPDRREKAEHIKKPISKKIVIIGSSTGGPRALQQVIPLLPPTLAVLVVQHMPPGFTKSLAERLNLQSRIRVREAREGDVVEPGTVLIAPGDFHMTVKQQMTNGGMREVIALTKGERVQGVRPSVDVLLKSAVPIYGERAVGVILTGMGSDGSEGIKKLKSAGGKVIAEDESTCVVFGMPKSVIDQKLADYVLPITKIAESIAQIA